MSLNIGMYVTMNAKFYNFDPCFLKSAELI